MRCLYASSAHYLAFQLVKQYWTTVSAKVLFTWWLYVLLCGHFIFPYRSDCSIALRNALPSFETLQWWEPVTPYGPRRISLIFEKFHICILPYIHTYIHTYSTLLHAYTSMHTYIHTYIAITINTYMHTCTKILNTYIHTYFLAVSTKVIHTYIHTYIHTCIQYIKYAS